MKRKINREAPLKKDLLFENQKLRRKVMKLEHQLARITLFSLIADWCNSLMAKARGA